jgi:phage gp46-like protein
VPDIRLVQRGTFPYQTEVSADWLLLGDGTLDQTQALATAVIVALGTDRLAAETDILPDPDSIDRRGWWGDLDAGTIWGGWPIGSRLWLLKRSKIVDGNAQEGSTLVKVKNFITEAIQPFIDIGLASRQDVSVARIDTQRIQATVALYRGPQLAIQLQYQVLWGDILPSGPTADVTEH